VREHVYERDVVVMGGSLEALLYAYSTNSTVFLSETHTPFEFDDTERDWGFLGFEPEKSLKLLEVWNRLYTALAMGGLVLNPLETQNWRLEDSLLTFITPKNGKITVNAKKFLLFDEPTEVCKVYDWFDMTSGGATDRELLESLDDCFVSKLMFFPSKRANVQRSKDVVSVSTLSCDQLEDPEYSEGIARLKALSLMKKAGMRGKKNGVNKRGTPLHYALKIEHSYREVIPVLKPFMPIGSVLSLKKQKGAMWRLTEDLFKRK